MRNSGSVIGGAINFSTNNTQDSAGGIDWSTYLIFVGFGMDEQFEERLPIKSSFLTYGRVHGRHMGLFTLTDQESPTPRRYESPNV